VARVALLPAPGPDARQPEAGEPLTRRELEILRLLAEGLGNREMARRLGGQAAGPAVAARPLARQGSPRALERENPRSPASRSRERAFIAHECPFRAPKWPAVRCRAGESSFAGLPGERKAIHRA
jgi:hypothetical protein